MTAAPFQYVAIPTHAGIGESLAHWPGGAPQGAMLVLVAEADREHVPDIQRAFAELGRPLAGAVFPALIVDRSFVNGGALLIPMPPGARVGFSEGLSSRPVGAAALREVAELAAGNPDEDATLFMLFDCMVPNIATLLDGLHLSLGKRVHYSGVNAGSESFQPIDCLFDGERFVRDAVLAMLLPGQGGVMLSHDYHAPTEVITATAAKGNRVTTIDWKPAFHVYQLLIHEMYGVEVVPENFYRHAVHFPLGIIRRDGEVVVRIPVGLDTDGAVTCVGEIPENSILTLLRAVDPDAADTARHLSAVAEHCSAPMVQAFYCAGRRMHLQEAARHELETLRDEIGLPLAGALSLGEIGTARDGHPLFHNAAVVCMPWCGTGST